MATAVKKRAGRRVQERVKTQGAVAQAYSAEEQRVRAVVEKYLPSVKDLVRSYEVKFQENFSGEPAVYVTLRIPRPDDPDKKRIERLLDFWDATSQDILAEAGAHFPHMRLEGSGRR